MVEDSTVCPCRQKTSLAAHHARHRHTHSIGGGAPNCASVPSCHQQSGMEHVWMCKSGTGRPKG